MNFVGGSENNFVLSVFRWEILKRRVDNEHIYVSTQKVVKLIEQMISACRLTIIYFLCKCLSGFCVPMKQHSMRIDYGYLRKWRFSWIYMHWDTNRHMRRQKYVRELDYYSSHVQTLNRYFFQPLFFRFDSVIVSCGQNLASVIKMIILMVLLNQRYALWIFICH